jgi:hypothetical protein
MQFPEKKASALFFAARLRLIGGRRSAPAPPEQFQREIAPEHMPLERVA